MTSSSNVPQLKELRLKEEATMKLATLRFGLAHTVSVVGLTALVNPAHAQEPMPAEPLVAAANRAVLSQLPFSDRQDFEDANRGFIATTPDSSNPDLYKFLQQDPPPTVNPS